MVWGPSPSKAIFWSVNHLCRTSSEPGVAALDTVLSQRLPLFLTPTLWQAGLWWGVHSHGALDEFRPLSGPLALGHL